MSLASMASGDSLTFYTVTDPGWGDSLTLTERTTKTGRVDTYSSDLDTRALESDEIRSYQAYFTAANDPGTKVGEYAQWTSTAGGDVTFSPVRVMRVVGKYEEGSPGSSGLVFVVEFAELTAEAASGLLP